jgi:hypothetical protein
VGFIYTTAQISLDKYGHIIMYKIYYISVYFVPPLAINKYR